jgi:hypothetical protein
MPLESTGEGNKMTDQRVNPELVKASAEMAIPNGAWELLDDGSVYNNFFMEQQYFDPLQSDSDAMKLERALKKKGWQFYAEEGTTLFCAQPHEFALPCDVLDNESDTMLLLVCVSSMTGIALYGERG